MGNVCSSGQKKKDDDNASEKSEDSPSYQLAEKKDGKKINRQSNEKPAPLADPEQISDLSTGQNTSIVINSPTNGTILKGATHTTKIHSNLSDSVSSTPQTINAPCDIPSTLPYNLQILQGKPITSRRTEEDRKIVIYLLSADNDHKMEKSVLQSICMNLRERCSNRNFELLISDTHSNETDLNSNSVLDVRKWIKNPLEAQGGHEDAANCLAEISRHSNFSYVIPVLFLGTTLGTPLLPLTIESQDFTTTLTNITDIKKRQLIEKWYQLDSSAQPQCYRLNVMQSKEQDCDECNIELNNLLKALIEIFSKELRDSYLTTLVEQEINNTVLINQELAKRCVWIQTGSQPPKLPEDPTILDTEMNRRLVAIHLELKNHISEKNLIRIPPTIQVQNDQLAAIMESLISTVIDGIYEEHLNKFSIPNCTFGIDKRLLNEVEIVSQYSRVLAENCANFSIMDKIKSYITGNSNAPLVIYGSPGSGKSVLAAKLMHSVHSIIPESNLILRYANLTELSSHLVSLVGSIAEQISVITNNEPCRVAHTISSYTDFIKNKLDKSKQLIIIVIDSLDEIEDLNTINWLPTQFPLNYKIILTCSNNNDNKLMNLLKDKNIPKDNYIELTKFSTEQWSEVLSYGGGDFYASNSGSLQLPEKWRNINERTPFQAKILWWLAWLGNFNIDDIEQDKIFSKIFDIIELKFTHTITEYILSLIVASKNGILETDLIQLLEESNLTKGESASKLWFKFCWLMEPMLLHCNQIRLMDKKINMIASQRYTNKIKEVHKILLDFYKKQNIIYSDKKGKFKCYNIQKLVKLPYHAFKIDNQNKTSLVNSILVSSYLNDLEWLQYKITATGCAQILNDINLTEKFEKIDPNQKIQLNLLKTFIEKYVRELNYDGDQFYTLLNSYIESSIKSNDDLQKNDVINKWLKFLKNIKTTYLKRLHNDTNEMKVDGKKHHYDLIANLGGKGYFVASISTEREEICVWDVSNCKRTRILQGIAQPTSLCPVGEYGAAVLCHREIKVIDLNEGRFKVTLKGVMNQKMPYFGLHDESHLVCLSRNRMYVNLMNLESGDCITTFKAGEDRFLNSLLVSGDGRILVCGDETQKPFPLLVWHLSQRKLLYDLRIPHHDFITSLSAITHEGSYVCVVAKELNEPTPNFIVVYDLQSGTLFKKWKPSCDTVSLAISQTNACVIAGLDDSRILIWDLVTGNCRCTLQGHNAPVTLLKLDPLGKILLSGDNAGRDMSIRLWELDSGKSLAVYTPPTKISTCEILPNGKYVILALENHSNLLTLTLCNYDDDDNKQEHLIYGNEENCGKIFDLK